MSALRTGRRSAFCGAVCAGCGAGAGIAYLEGGGYDAVAHTLVYALAVISGMVCGGAKASCAAKIAAAVEAGILGYRMYTQHQEFYSGDGIVVKGVDNTIRNIGRLAKDGMRETESQILSMMLETKTRAQQIGMKTAGGLALPAAFVFRLFYWDQFVLPGADAKLLCMRERNRPVRARGGVAEMIVPMRAFFQMIG